MMRYFNSILTAIAVLIIFSGCQESNSSQIQRARLVGNENIQLKKQLEKKDAQIAQLKKDLEQLRTEKGEESKAFGETNIRIMQIIAETDQEIQQLRKENEELKAQIEQLKAQ